MVYIYLSINVVFKQVFLELHMCAGRSSELSLVKKRCGPTSHTCVVTKITQKRAIVIFKCTLGFFG